MLFGQILQSGQLLLGVVNDILDFSKIEAGKLHVEALPVHVRQLLERTLTAIHAQATEHQLTVSLDIDPALPTYIASDPLRLEQALLNLLTNAVKFTHQGAITVRARRSTGHIVMEVSDTGIGMTPEQLSNLFSPFTQADNSTTRRYGGTGLGLSITKRLIELLGGHIQASSVAGEGATFRITLPLVEASTPQTQAHAARPRAPLQAGGRLQGLTILAAEDNAVNQIVLGEFLRLEGATTTFVDSGQAAIDAGRTQPPGHFDLVLMDVQMPLVDGYEATRQIKSWAPNQIIIGQTAHALQEEHAKCLASGMADMIVKPLELDKMVQTILTHCPSAHP